MGLRENETKEMERLEEAGRGKREKWEKKRKGRSACVGKKK